MSARRRRWPPFGDVLIALVIGLVGISLILWGERNSQNLVVLLGQAIAVSGVVSSFYEIVGKRALFDDIERRLERLVIERVLRIPPGLQYLYTRLYDVQQHAPLQAVFESAEKRIVVMGPTLSRVTVQDGLLSEILQRRPNLRVDYVFFKPSENDPSGIAMKLLSHIHATDVEPSVDATIVKVENLCQRFSQVNQHPLYFMPTYSAIVLDPDERNAEIYIDHHIFNTPSDRRLYLAVRKAENPDLFERYWRPIDDLIKNHPSILGRPKQETP